VLSFLGAGHTPRAGKYKNNVKRGIKYLISRQATDGSIGSNLWTRALASTALSETYGMSRNAEAGLAAQRAVKALAGEIASSPWELQQGLAGDGWPDDASNLTVVAMALKSAKVARLKVESAAFVRLMALLGDLESKQVTPLNAAATLLIRQYLGYARDDEQNIRDAETLIANLPRWERGKLDYRYLFYGTHAMFQMGGKHWRRWNVVVRDMLIDHMEKGGANDGSFPPIGVCGVEGGKPYGGASRVYSTALGNMCLEVYYRYLPIYGGSGSTGGGSRGSGGGFATSDEKKHYVAPIISASGRDFRYRALQRESLPSDGGFKLVTVERRALKPHIYHLAAPVAYRGAFLQAEVTNDRPEPLLAGEARIYLGTDLSSTRPTTSGSPSSSCSSTAFRDPRTRASGSPT